MPSDPDSTAASHWSLSLRCIRVRGAPVRLTGGKPQWYAMIYSLGIFSLSRSLLAVAGAVDITVTIAAHAGSCALGVAFGRYISKAVDGRIPRIWSGAIGLIGCGLAVISPELIPDISPDAEIPGAADIWTRIVIPLTTLALMLIVHLVGEAMVTWFPHDTSASPPAPAGPRLRRRLLTPGNRGARRDPAAGAPE